MERQELNPDFSWTEDQRPFFLSECEREDGRLKILIQKYPAVLGSVYSSKNMVAGGGFNFHPQIDIALMKSDEYSSFGLGTQTGRFHIYHEDDEGKELDINIFAYDFDTLIATHILIRRALRTVDTNTEKLRAYLDDLEAQYNGPFDAFDPLGLKTGAEMQDHGELFRLTDPAIVYDHVTGVLASGGMHDAAAWKLGFQYCSQSLLVARHSSEEVVIKLNWLKSPSEIKLQAFAERLLALGVSPDKKVEIIGQGNTTLGKLGKIG